ncbi:small RNA 2'-O-methyltransferase [Latimeria chalumnae]|uniref:Small RNA 2'-O-methyltransferase n=1 Tax=Latimeria chalumnae TaxID=7897 RepID=H3B738_LATCH|nr:PREDICTED: small RNA 2'-O-methyltransferase [Latimeria chalumnae]|eukprot:XP_005997796.1 PREDICTED: small RNA 2'-O-methyltransferase [Latimeria chalumnae]
MEAVSFTPPLYKQRYNFVADVVNTYQPKKVVDMGCADCTLLWKLKFCNCIEVLAGLDIDADTMKEKIHRLSPLPCDYVWLRKQPLTITLYQGSVAEKDASMLDFDLVTCIELIEHLELPVLEKFPEVVFGYMAPTMVIISTPNADFNPLLPGLTRFRHPDHKFEWSRAEFQKWAQDAACQYGYTVEFTGVGNGPPGTENKGFCTQIGVFIRSSHKNGGMVTTERDELGHSYKIVFQAVYPSLQDKKYLQIAVTNEVIYRVEAIKRSLLSSDDAEEGDKTASKHGQPSDGHVEASCTVSEESSAEPYIHGNSIYVPLAKLFSFSNLQKLCGSLDELQQLLSGKVTLSSDSSAVVSRISCEDVSPEEED